MATKPVKISILADAKDAVKGFDKAGAAAKDAGNKFEGAAEGADTVASKGAQAAGALTGLGDLVGGKFGAGMAVAGTAMQAAADAGDLLNVAVEGGQKVLGKAVAAAQALGKAETYSAAAKKVSAAAQWVLNAAMSANPIGIVVIAIVALVAAFVIAYKKSETFRAIVQGAWAKIKAASVAVFAFLKSFIPAAFAFIKNAFLRYTPLGIIISHFGQIRSFVTGAWNSAKSATSNAWNGIKSAVSNAINALMGTVRGIRGRVLGAFSSAGDWLLSAGRKIVQGLIDGVSAMVRPLRDKFNQITNMIPDWKGPADRDKKLLFGAGQLIMGGLVNGIDKGKADLKDQLKSVTRLVAGTDMGSVSLDARAAFAGSGGSGGSAHITYELNVSVPATANPAETGRAIVKAINAYERSGGRRTA